MNHRFIGIPLLFLCTSALADDFVVGVYDGALPGMGTISALEIKSIEGAVVKVSLSIPGKTKNNACAGVRDLIGSVVDGVLTLGEESTAHWLPECVITLSLKSDGGRLSGTYNGRRAEFSKS